MAAIIKVGDGSYMFPVASFVYPVFVNLDLLKAAGVETMPSNRTEFVEAARKLTDASKNQYGWVLPLSLQSPERHPERRDVVGLGVRQEHAEGRQARPDQRRTWSARSSTSSRCTTKD